MFKGSKTKNQTQALENTLAEQRFDNMTLQALKYGLRCISVSKPKKLTP